MKRFRAVLAFSCDSEDCANTIEKKIVAVVGEQNAVDVTIQMREEVCGNIVRPKTVPPGKELPAKMDYDEIFEPSPSAL